MKNEIQIMFCFNNNYVIPAAVCFNSILQNSNKNNIYIFNVLHSDITKDNIKHLTNEIQKFNNCKINFINMNNRYDDLFSQIPNHSHFSKELIYKLICPSLFPKLKKIIITDVDVVFLDDIAKIYDKLDDNNDCYIAGIPSIKKNRASFYRDKLYSKFSSKEIDMLEDGVGAGFLLLNLDLMRKNKIENSFLDYLNKNKDRLIQIEQDVINIVCFGKIKKLPYNFMVCTYEYTDFKNGTDFSLLKDKKEMKKVKIALNFPIQLHYATCIKPWVYVDSCKSYIWFKYFFQTDFSEKYLLTIKDRSKSINGFFPKFMKTKLYKILLSVYHFLKRILCFIK